MMGAKVKLPESSGRVRARRKALGSMGPGVLLDSVQGPLVAMIDSVRGGDAPTH
jgi:hypothetical protein